MTTKQIVLIIIFGIIWYSLFTVNKDMKWWFRAFRIFWIKMWRTNFKYLKRKL